MQRIACNWHLTQEAIHAIIIFGHMIALGQTVGTFCSSVTLKGPSQDQLVGFFTQRGHPALISAAIGGVATVFPVEFQRAVVVSFQLEVPTRYHRGATGWEPLVRDLSRQFVCAAWAVEVFDDDVCYYRLYDAGQLIDEYSRSVDYFGPFRSRTPAALNAFLLRTNHEHAALLCDVFESSAVNDVARCLSQPIDPFHGYGAADKIHRVLVDVLALPTFAGYCGVLAAYGSREADFGQGSRPAFVSTPPHWTPTWESP